MNSPKRLFVLSLAAPTFALGISNVFLNLFLIDIALTFQVSEGVAVQLRTVNAIAEIIFCLLMGLLATRFSHKSLLLTGASLVVIAALGNSFVYSFDMMLFFFFIEGIGSVIVAIMAFTLIGDLLTLDKKAKVVSWITAATSLTIFIGTPLLTYIVGFGNWHYAFLLFTLPVSVAALVLAFIGVPSSGKNSLHSVVHKELSFTNFKQVIQNKSAVKCLLGTIFFTGSGSAVFVVAFFRQRFSISTEGIVYVTLIALFISIVGCLFAGRIANRFGVKNMVVAGATVNGVLLTLVFFSSDLWIALLCDFISVWFLGMGMSAYNCLVLDQVPNYRETMMSLSRLFVSLSNLMTSALGGTLLVVFSFQSLSISYQTVGLMFGATQIMASILYLTVKDPYKKINRDLIRDNKAVKSIKQKWY